MQTTLTQAIPTGQPRRDATGPIHPETPATEQPGVWKQTSPPDPSAENWARRAMHSNGFGDGGF